MGNEILTDFYKRFKLADILKCFNVYFQYSIVQNVIFYINLQYFYKIKYIYKKTYYFLFKKINFYITCAYETIQLTF